MGKTRELIEDIKREGLLHERKDKRVLLKD